MNKERRDAIEKAQGLIEEAKDILQEACDEEQEYFNNMPESLQGGDKGQAAENAISILRYAIDNLDNCDAIGACE